MKRSAQAKRPASKTTSRAARARGGVSASGTKTSPDLSAPAPTAPEKIACEATGSAADFLPPKMELPVLREASRGCRGCTLYCNATQTVFGEGPAGASVMFVGEQPGDQEDRAGRPFVGPSGQLLDEALREAGVPRDECYVTNAVKHFKFEPRGKRRIHSKPSAREVAACRPWLEAEIQLVRPTMIVCLGATAAQSLLGRDFRVTQHRGEVLKSDWAPAMLATVHPSSLLRVPDPEMRREARRQFVGDMKVVARQIRKEAR
jgi:uracil-DNA glycosylase